MLDENGSNIYHHIITMAQLYMFTCVRYIICEFLLNNRIEFFDFRVYYSHYTSIHIMFHTFITKTYTDIEFIEMHKC